MLHSTLWEAFQSQKKVSTDTRKIQQGDIFIALKGDNFNGNRFAAQALESGAAFAVVDEAAVVPPGDSRYILVENALEALQALGREWRKQFDIPFIGITGSNGKTTTKELMHAVLGSEKRAYATSGNLNNHIGVPLTLLAMPEDTELAVIEMGANKPKDIEELVNIALPTHGLITNIGSAHLEGMGGLDGVQRTKGEMFVFIRENGGFAFINEADPRIVAESMGIERSQGYNGPDSPFRILSTKEDESGQDLLISAEGEELQLRIQMQGLHNAQNALLAFAVGRHFGISDKGIQTALAAYAPKMNRSQLVISNGRKFLLDAYNANPSSMQATIKSIALQGHQNVALILGDMFELGSESTNLHRELWEFALQHLPNAKVIGVGPTMAQTMPQKPNCRSFENIEAAKNGISAAVEACDYILIKGSRGMALERLLPDLGVQL